MKFASVKFVDDSVAPRNWQGGHDRGSGGIAPSRQQIFAVFTLKNTDFSTLFIEKVHAVSAVTMDNAKMFSQRMSKNRSLAKIRERRLQPLSVWDIID